MIHLVLPHQQSVHKDRGIPLPAFLTLLHCGAMPYVNNGQLDAVVLAAMGYDQQLSRGIRNWMMSAALGFIAIGTVPFTGIDLALLNGGPASALAAWLVVSLFSIIAISSLAEVSKTSPAGENRVSAAALQVRHCFAGYVRISQLGRNVPLGWAARAAGVGPVSKLCDRNAAALRKRMQHRYISSGLRRLDCRNHHKLVGRRYLSF